jgi:hypothetical protein
LHGGGGTRVAGWETGQPARPSDPAASANSFALPPQQRAAQTAPPTPDSVEQPQPPKKHKGFLERLRGIFK